MLLGEAKREGARLNKCCEVLDISLGTYQRWKSGSMTDKRKGAVKIIPRKLTEEEEQEIIDISCSLEFKDSNPYEIVITLLERMKYVASISSFYRVLKAMLDDLRLLNKRETGWQCSLIGIMGITVIQGLTILRLSK